jgi:hypothetical protein
VFNAGPNIGLFVCGWEMLKVEEKNDGKNMHANVGGRNS